MCFPEIIIFVYVRQMCSLMSLRVLTLSLVSTRNKGMFAEKNHLFVKIKLVHFLVYAIELLVEGDCSHSKVLKIIILISKDE